MYKLWISKLYGIKNRTSFSFKNNLVIFAPNGVGKTSIRKGFENIINNEEFYTNLEGENLKISESIKFYKNGEILSDKKIQNETGIISNSDIKLDIFQKANFLEHFNTDNKSNLDNEIKELSNEYNLIKVLNDQFHDDRSVIKYFNKVINSNNTYDYTTEQLSEAINGFKKIKEIISKNNLFKKLTKKTYTKWKKIRSTEREDFNLFYDEDILQNIKEKSRDNLFQYYYNNKWITIGDAIRRIKQKIASKIPNNEVEIYEIINQNSIINNNDDFNKKMNHSSTRYQNLETQIENIIIKLENDIINMKIFSDKILINKRLNKVYRDKSKVVKNINSLIKNINKFFNSNTLEWKIKINEIVKFTDELKIEYQKGDVKYADNEQFAKYASDGEKAILILISWLFILNNKKIIIFDDIISSMDNHHIDEFLLVVKSKMLSNVKCKIFLTHNFVFFRSMSYKLKKLRNDTSFFIMDKIDDKTIKCIKIRDSELQSIMNPKYYKNNSNLIGKILLVSNIIRELIENYLFLENIPILGLDKDHNVNYHVMSGKKESKDLLKLTQLIDSRIRHYKLKGNNKTIKERIKKIKVNLPLFNLFCDLVMELDDNKFLSKEIIHYDSNLYLRKIKTLIDYVFMKVIIGTQIRFISERKKYYETNNAVKVLWETDKNWEKANSLLKTTMNYDELKKLDTTNVNYINHIDNIQWSKIIEMPLYKIMKIHNDFCK